TSRTPFRAGLADVPPRCARPGRRPEHLTRLGPPRVLPAVRSAPMSFAPIAPPAATRLIDPRGHRFGAGLSVVLLALGFALDVPLVVPAIGVALGVSASFGTRSSILARPCPFVRQT